MNNPHAPQTSVAVIHVLPIIIGEQTLVEPVIIGEQTIVEKYPHAPQ